ncbi:hypothetical protein BC938DRAFT_478788 [Jimgerdemannia flammicorona]|uniref:Uncharacterized protein n=1 Tax=Jimgerdemannia flammicorona TaxID=994334 RepID=A0A433QMA8_9FUNG|nr:hypothetical protein BC938DRAFT_478788 [Jimgerdemannia flammicorona]
MPIDARDVNTPDNWIPRNPYLIRLPFNCEHCSLMYFRGVFPLPTPMENGFTTPSDLHYVRQMFSFHDRNHGAVPQLSWDARRVQVSG